MMYFILYTQTEEKISLNIDEVTKCLVQGWKLYGYADSEKQADYLMNECQNC